MSLLAGLVLQTGGIDYTSLLYALSFLFVPVYIILGPRLQVYMALNDIGRGLSRLKLMKDKARKETIDYVTTTGKTVGDPSPRIDQFLDYVTIMPVDIDPNGIVGKIDHVVTVRDERVRTEVGDLVSDKNPVTVSVSENLLEVAGALNNIHKVVRHYYLLGKKTNSYFMLLQLQMIMPQIVQEADALLNAVDTFKLAQPVGDGIGPVIASRYMYGRDKQVVAKDTVMSISEYKGRKLYVMKAEGPMAYVGQPGVGIKHIIDDMGVKPSAIIMIDAALKLEGEKTGEIAEGVGAAIGGIGVEKYQIEEVASGHKIPIYAILVKQSILEAISAMRKEIAEASDKVMTILGRVIEEKTKEGDNVVIAGIGNTLGVAQ
ncbi:MAG: DUF1512 domain-containing protein [Thaumarchaeota archaeon]|nr:DUF1512 domain-containing protein [Nitrososphaerota archaeon]